MKTTHTITSEQFLPTLVLKNTVLFPDVALPVLVSKPVGLNALHRAIDSDKERRFVALSLKEGAEIDNIKSSDFYTVGTLCIVERIEKNEKGESIAYVRSVERFQAKSIQFESAFNSWAAQGEIVPDIIDLDGPTEKALLTSLKEVSREILLSINATETFKRTLEDFKDAGLFTNVVAQHLPLIISKKQEILELASIKNRALKVLELLVEQR